MYPKSLKSVSVITSPIPIFHKPNSFSLTLHSTPSLAQSLLSLLFLLPICVYLKGFGTDTVLLEQKRMKKRNQSDAMDSKDDEWSFRKIMKDIDLFGASHMTWKERKDLENRKVVSLGGKPPKKQRLPLSVARVQMKKQKEREEKMLQENMILGRFGGKLGGSAKRSMEKRRPGDRVLKTTEGYFKNGILDVKHMLNPSSSGGSDSGNHMFNGGGKKKKKKGNGKRNRGKKKHH